MGMGYGGSYADVISNENIEKLAPDEYAAFMAAFEDIDAELEEYAKDVAWCQAEDKDWGDVESKFVDLQRSLQMQHDICLSINYHNSEENGSRYDGVDGQFFEVNNRMIRNPELSTDIHEMVERQFYVTYG